MAMLWSHSLTPWTDRNGDPYAGAKAYFFDASTTTPQIVYTDASLSIPHDHPVVANSDGEFPPVFFVEETSHRIRITTGDDVTIWDVDGISVPTTIPPDPPTSNTETQFLFQTGDIKMAWRTSAPTGFVRLNGRSIGAAASGATERANSDTEALFKFLWNQDANLSVSGGRGATADGDWAAAKRIDLPDFRGRSPLGMDGMGNSAANRVTDAQLGDDSDELGSAGGEAAHALTTPELAAHTHPGTTASGGAHTHGGVHTGGTLGGGGNASPPPYVFQSQPDLNGTTGSGGAHTHTFTTDSTGSGTAHNNLQPSIVVPFFIKL